METFYNTNMEQFDKNIEDILEKLLTNSLKIIIKQDEINLNYYEKIKYILKEGSHFKNSMRDGMNRNSKTLNLKNNDDVISVNSSLRKKKLAKISDSTLLYDERMKEQIDIEKSNLKYRLMFLKSFTLDILI